MLWQHCLTHLKTSIPETEFNVWLLPLQATEQEKGLYLYAPNQFVMQKVNDDYIHLITDKVRKISGNSGYKVSIQVGSNTLAFMDAASQQKDDERPFQASIDKKTNNNTSSNTSVPLAKKFTNTLSPRMTFENFVEGKSNQLARAAALQVGENAGGDYNPFFIYGGVGLGKTHLMHAIGNKIRERNHDAKVIYLHSEQFVNDMVNTLRNNSIEDFKQYYRSADALLIDDIQFFAKKERSMEEFFHTFNALLESQKQIVIAGDRIPLELDVHPRLKTRMNWGLTLAIEPPDLETRVAILSKKIEETRLSLSNDVAFFIAERFKANVRDLEGALNRVIASANLRNQEVITLAFVRDVLHDQIIYQNKLISIDNIKKTVANYYNIKVNDIDSKKRVRNIARPRQLAMALAKELTEHSLPEIGREFGGRDHTTVLHGCRKIEELRTLEPNIAEDWNILIRTLSS